jgi:hypothetical protein
MKLLVRAIFLWKIMQSIDSSLQVFFDNYIKSFCWFKWESWEIQIVQSIGLFYVTFVLTNITNIKLLTLWSWV